MNMHRVIILLVGIFSLFCIDLSAQTCRVSVGCCKNGTPSYIEVYEYDYVDVKPEFPGGCQSMRTFINENRKYPGKAYKAGIEGRVICSFVVNTDGSVSNLSVIKGVEETLNEEALRVLSNMPVWTPGSISGKDVPVRVVYAIPFRK